MEMSERKLQILQAIIMNYLEDGEPVGSRTISKKFLTDYSSATIRNEMSDLEELGLIEQPHTSAGRVPSSKGYRLYVDQLMQRTTFADEDAAMVREILMAKTKQLDSMLKEIGDLLATITKYTAVVTVPSLQRIEIKHIQLMPLDEASALLVLITDGNIVRNNVIPLSRPLSSAEIRRVSQVLDSDLQGKTISEITLPVVQKIKKECGLDQETMENLLNAINESLQQLTETDVFTSGTNNILNFPEFSNIARARALMEFFNQKDQVLHMVSGPISRQRTGLNISIGTENSIEQLRDCSIVTATYRYKESSMGSISVVGPMRMNYNRVVSALENMMHDFPDLFSDDEEDEEESAEGADAPDKDEGDGYADRRSGKPEEGG